MSFTVYTKEGAEAINPSYFKRLRQSQPGIQRAMLGRALPVLHADFSYFVAKLSHREQRQGHYLTRKQERKVKGWYVTTRTQYAVATINWDTGFVTELELYPTQHEATERMQVLHRS